MLCKLWMYRAHGTITLVQEERFELACDDGSHKHFVLAHDAPLEADELERLEQEGAVVEVEYDDSPDLIMHTAHRLWRDSHGSRH